MKRLEAESIGSKETDGIDGKKQAEKTERNRINHTGRETVHRKRNGTEEEDPCGDGGHPAEILRSYSRIRKRSGKQQGAVA